MSTVVSGGTRLRLRVRVQGTVQGVGFRPYVYRLAVEQRLAGFVRNDERGVLLEVEGDRDAVERFMTRMASETPPLARVDQVMSERVALAGERAFRIVESDRGGEPTVPVTPDSATCEQCLAELLDPVDRRYRYPFINCTNCGPRFTIVHGVPYDRRLTTMSAFPMCPECRREYEDPANRRFHAQPNACPACGPRVRLCDASGNELPRHARLDAIDRAAQMLGDGGIVAIKGLGGFHLACDALDGVAVGALRARKHREDRPFALMVPSVEAARELVELGEEEERMLCSPARAIVLAPRVDGAPVSPAVAPAVKELGVMLPYTPLHHLLLGDFGRARGGNPAALVMTSGNVSDEPIAYCDADALTRLDGIADAFLLHDRPIATRTDDSVVRAVTVGAQRQALMLRRSRGYVPGHLALPVPAAEAVLACGAEQKNTFCVAKHERAWVSHHIGDLEHYATLRAFREGIEHFERLFAVQPLVVAHDLHPDYLSTAYALEREEVRHIGVQHHHAHLAACLAEHGFLGSAVGAIFDGTGYGSDGTIWGGELLVGDLLGFERAGSLLPVRMPGASAAIREPWRMAFAWLAEAQGEPGALPRALQGVVSQRQWQAMGPVAASEEVSPLTTSMGRLFDGIAALCGIGARVSYEGQAAVEFEAAGAARRIRGGYEIAVVDGGAVLDPREAVLEIARDLRAGVSVADVSARFHAGVAEAAAQTCAAIAALRSLDTVVLSGGVFQNRLLLESAARRLQDAGLRVLLPRQLPPNDGGISYGQTAVAAAQTGQVPVIGK